MIDDTELTTPENLPEEAIRKYQEEGYLHIPRVLTDEEVAECYADAKKLIEEEKGGVWDDSVDEMVKDKGATVMQWLEEAETRSEALRRLALHPRVTTIAEMITGRPLRMFRSEILRKPSDNSAATPPHIDEPYWPWQGGVTMTAWVALVDVPVERGCMSFVPGSNKIPPPGPGDWDIFSKYPELTWRPRVTVPLRAGGCTFHNERVVHMAGANLSGSDRLSLGTVYIDAETRFDPDAGFSEEDLGFGPGDLIVGDKYPLVGTFSG
ncbi:phytanoyl-CoA dioxygenase family protein [Nocardiopsis sp. N85]|uniref:phytanoyl-CoA dioxygenase family protein n=1 Tax=Nocardiopsis sp. N85 TaxID=3029400 RepID=UPI00237F6ECE|nr:phytanoyl-CoA dioxygenase family protein [Nocardiopsis sp. N85]MDE3723800.1 phytanoyl-CoA dioxygenase family protein [Nocardiopsis sp. N85]